MSVAHLAGPDDLTKLLPMVGAFHQEMGLDTDAAHREAGIAPLLEGLPHGAIWLIGPRMAPVGYVVVSFGWSVEFGGMDGILDEIYVRPAVRGRGMASEALWGISKALREAGVKALHLEVSRDDEAAQKFYAKAHFKPRPGYLFMTRTL